MSTDPDNQANLTMSGTAPSGESFDISLYFTRPGALPARCAALAKAAEAVSQGMLLNRADDPR